MQLFSRTTIATAISDSAESQFIGACLYFASGLLLLFAGNRLANWISNRDALRKRMDSAEKRLDRQDIKNERTLSALHRLEDERRVVRTSYNIEDSD